MKVIFSHDIDHLTVAEHLNDMIIPKFIVRMKIELLLGKITIKEILKRYSNLIHNKWQNLDELMDFNEKSSIPSTFFIGVNQGVGLNYSNELSEKWIKHIIKRGFDCGVHGIAFNNKESMQKEYDVYKNISGLDKFGIRMHYLRNQEDTLINLDKCGYTFDSTQYGILPIRKIGKMVEFPLHIMEGYVLENGKKWQSRNLNEAVKYTISQIKFAEKSEIEYLTILFHDRYFDDSFITWKKWYIEIVKFCKSEDFVFTNYKSAVKYLK